MKKKRPRSATLENTSRGLKKVRARIRTNAYWTIINYRGDLRNHRKRRRGDVTKDAGGASILRGTRRMILCIHPACRCTGDISTALLMKGTGGKVVCISRRLVVPTQFKLRNQTSPSLVRDGGGEDRKKKTPGIRTKEGMFPVPLTANDRVMLLCRAYWKEGKKNFPYFPGWNRGSLPELFGSLV